jgi:hypothetical protein
MKKWPFQHIYVGEKQMKRANNISDIRKSEMRFVRNVNRSKELYEIIKDKVIFERVNINSVNAETGDKTLTRLSRMDEVRVPKFLFPIGRQFAKMFIKL